MRTALFGVALIALLPLLSVAQETYTYRMPDVRNDYCGVEVNYQYCKCAFHGDYCNAVNQTESSARTFVMGGFRTWVGDQIESMARNCLDDGNHWSASARTCTYAPEPEAPELPQPTLTERYSLPNMDGVPEPTKSGYYGKITKAEGETFVYQWSFKRWVEATPGMPIYHGDFVKTLKGETRVITNTEYGDYVVQVADDSFLETGLRNQRPERPASEYSFFGMLRDGAVEIYNELKEGAQQETPVPEWYIQLHTPNVSTGVRGTRFLATHVEETDATTITLTEGILDVRHIDATTTITLAPGERALAGSTDISTTTADSYDTLLSEAGLPTERIDPTAAERTHDAPEIPVDNFPSEPEPTREALVGDLSEIDSQFEDNSFTQIIIFLCGFAVIAWFIYNRLRPREEE